MNEVSTRNPCDQITLLRLACP